MSQIKQSFNTSSTNLHSIIALKRDLGKQSTFFIFLGVCFVEEVLWELALLFCSPFAAFSEACWFDCCQNSSSCGDKLRRYIDKSHRLGQ